MKNLFLAALFLASPLLAQVNVAPYRTPRVTLTDPNGVPLANGCVYFYQGGTSTPQATYTDYTGTTQNTNPVILDSTGSANIWLGPNTYKIVAWSTGGTNCSTGVQQWSVDQVPGDLFNNVTISGATISNSTISSSTLSGNTITGGTIDNTPIGSTTPSTGRFTTITAATQTVSFSSTPTFPANSFNAFAMTLTGNVTSSSITGGAIGQILTFTVCQDATGGRTFVWPTNVSPASPPFSGAANACTTLRFLYNGTTWNLLPGAAYQSFTAAQQYVLSASGAASAGSTVYTGTFPNGASNALAGLTFLVQGFSNGASNGSFVATASTLTTLTLSNASGVAQTQAATATTTTAVALSQEPVIVLPVGQFAAQDNQNASTALYLANLGIAGSGIPGNARCNTLTIDSYGRVTAVSSTSYNCDLVQATGSPAVTGCSLSGLVGSAEAGKFVSGVAGTCTATFNFSGLAPNGLSCWANDLTTPSDKISQTSTSQTQAVLSGTTASGDVITYGCVAY